MQTITAHELELLKKQTPFLSSKQMAELFGYKSDDALRKQRSKNGTLIFPYIKIGNKVFYPLSKTLELAEKNLVKA